MEISESKAFAIFTTLGLLCGIGQAITMGERVEGRLEIIYPSDMAVWEVFVLAYGQVAIFLNIFVAVFDAYALGHKKWAFANIMIWPLSFVFIWLSATGYFYRKRRACGT